jgi:hypothetical protein
VFSCLVVRVVGTELDAIVSVEHLRNMGVKTYGNKCCVASDT